MRVYFPNSKLLKKIILYLLVCHFIPYVAKASGTEEPGEERVIRRNLLCESLLKTCHKGEREENRLIKHLESPKIENTHNSLAVCPSEVFSSDASEEKHDLISASSIESSLKIDAEIIKSIDSKDPKEKEIKLEHLPRDVLKGIASFLPLSDIVSLGRTCHHIENEILKDEGASYWGNFRVEGLTAKQTLKLLHEVIGYCVGGRDLSGFAKSTLERLNFRLPIDFLEFAASSGQKDAQVNLAVCYILGQDVPKDSKRGEYWLKRSALR